jgi:uncharacterized repeat protein (TIGR03803 family)
MSRQSCPRPSLLGATLLLLLAGTGTAQVFTVLVKFGKTASNPYFVTPVQGRDGRLYATTLNDDVNDAGTIFAVDPNTGLRFIPHRFDTATGASPRGGLTLGIDGNFYGTTAYGGTSGYGVLYRIEPNGTYTVLHNFAGGSDGLYPNAPPVQGADGNFYGTTGSISAQGDSPSIAYRYTLSGTFTTLTNLPSTTAPLIQGTDGSLYGTWNGFFSDCGGIFKMSTSGTMLYTYNFGPPPCINNSGDFPMGPIMQASDGNFYGTTQNGGAGNYGTVYKMDQTGNVSLLYSMLASSDNTDGGLVQGTDGNLYGDAWGYPSSLFEITTGGSFTLLHTLTGQEGGNVGAGLLQHTNGKFYGTAETGGSGIGGGGTLFTLDMGLAPFISLVKNQGRVGGVVQILGQGLTGSTSVTFNGLPATSFHISSSFYMTAVVPTGATTGPVVVTTPSGMLTSNRNFQIVH